MKIFFPLLSLLLSLSALSQTTIIHTPTNNLEESLEFYKKLEYRVLSEANPTLVTDGKAIIEINPDRFARAGVKMFKASWKDEVEKLKAHTVVYEIEKGFLLNDLNGCWIYLIEGSLGFELDSTDTSTAVVGNYMGLSLESANINSSFEIWRILGLNVTMGDPKTGFVVLDNEEGFGVSLMAPLMCPHLFFNPSMTFFNGKNNVEIIEKIRKLDIPITEEISIFNSEGIVDNIIIRDPGGYGFFIFSD